VRYPRGRPNLSTTELMSHGVVRANCSNVITTAGRRCQQAAGDGAGPDARGAPRAPARLQQTTGQQAANRPGCSGCWPARAGPSLHAGHPHRAYARHSARPGPHVGDLQLARQPSPPLTRQFPERRSQRSPRCAPYAANDLTFITAAISAHPQSCGLQVCRRRSAHLRTNRGPCCLM
jgi:hypothetical protein